MGSVGLASARRDTSNLRFSRCAGPTSLERGAQPAVAKLVAGGIARPDRQGRAAAAIVDVARPQSTASGSLGMMQKIIRRNVGEMVSDTAGRCLVDADTLACAAWRCPLRKRDQDIVGLQIGELRWRPCAGLRRRTIVVSICKYTFLTLCTKSLSLQVHALNPRERRPVSSTMQQYRGPAMSYHRIP